MKEKLEGYIKEALRELGIADADFAVEHPTDMTHGDWATNVAMVIFAKAKKIVADSLDTPARKMGFIWRGDNPRGVAEYIKDRIENKKDPGILAIEIAGSGFINFKLAPGVFDNELARAISEGDKWGRNETLKGKKVMVEYTDPNPFKEFHVGHLMSNAVGEGISRLVEASGADVKRACYQGDVGLHVATAVWAMAESRVKNNPDYPEMPNAEASIAEKVQYLGRCYKYGNLKGSVSGDYFWMENDIEHFGRVITTTNAARESGGVDLINKKIYERSDPQINELYQWGREVSLKYFETIYKRLGTKFDYFFFESETGEIGKKIVEENKGKVFEESEGATVFHAEKFNPKLHTRVFINKDGLPTYEAKELGLAKEKYKKFPYDISVVITGNEVNDYFQVLLEAMRQIFPDLAAKTEHLSHGMLRLPTGKMSSRTGDVITAESLLSEVKARVMEKIKNDVLSSDKKNEIAEMVSVAAVKYSILRQASGKDIIFDFEQSLSFEGDSGPYLQYTHARVTSVLEKSDNAPIDPYVPHEVGGVLPRLLARFPEVVKRSARERESHFVATYLIELAREFNSFYGNTLILDGSSEQPYKLALTKAVGQTLKNGLWLLGIQAPKKM